MEAILESVIWDYAQLGAAFLGLVASILFLFRYLREAGRAAWDNRYGRYLIERKAVLAAFFLLAIVNRLAGRIVSPDDFPAQDVITCIVFSALALQTFVPYRILLDAQKAHNQEEAREDARG